MLYNCFPFLPYNVIQFGFRVTCYGDQWIAPTFPNIIKNINDYDQDAYEKYVRK